jgi:hypothetical protein
MEGAISMSYNDAAVATNLLNPATLSFCLGAAARFVRSELSIPKDVHSAISLFLLLAIGLKGGHELAGAPIGALVGPVTATVLLGVLTPVIAFLLLRGVGRLTATDSAAIAAHYGSVSVVTFIAAQTFVTEALAARPDLPRLEGYLPTLVALLESPGIMVALLLGCMFGKSSKDRDIKGLIHEVVTGRTMFLLLGGLVLGSVMGQKNWASIAPFFDPAGGVFRGLLCFFLLEMGISAASRLAEVRRSAPVMLGFGILLPLINASLGIIAGHWAGLSVGGTAVLATMASSASYIAAPPAVKATLPDANPAYYLTMALAVTFPFNIVVGIPLYFDLTERFFKIFS